MAANTVCRASTGPCDPAEVCNGTLLTCPANATTPNGQPGTCTGGQVCCGGACTTLGTLTNCESAAMSALANEVCTSVAALHLPDRNLRRGLLCDGHGLHRRRLHVRGGPGDACDTDRRNDCQTGLTCCGGTCRNLQTNPDFCGTCDHRLRRPDSRHLPGRADLHGGRLRLRPGGGEHRLCQGGFCSNGTCVTPTTAAPTSTTTTVGANDHGTTSSSRRHDGSRPRTGGADDLATATDAPATDHRCADDHDHNDGAAHL